MSRPAKAIVEYFPHFVQHGRTMFTLESKFGNDGYAFWFKLLEMLGASEHHFLNCNNPETWEYLLAKTRVSEETANEILCLLSRLDAIDNDLWDYRIIRSSNLIENLSPVYGRRTINVISNDEVLGLCIHKPDSTIVNVDINPQSIVKKSKVKDSNPQSVFAFENYTQNADLIQRLNEFIEMRKAIKKPMTDRAQRGLLTKLDDLASTDVEKIKILEQSIFNSWQGVFPLKQEGRASPQNMPRSGTRGSADTDSMGRPI